VAAYLDQAGLVLRLGFEEVRALSNDDDESAAEINSAVVEATLLDCESRINSYLRSAYNLPLSQVPDSIKQAVAVFWRYWRDKKRRREDVLADYEEVKEWLLQVSKGEIDLGDIGAEQDSGSSGLRVKVKNPQRFFIEG